MMQPPPHDIVQERDVPPLPHLTGARTATKISQGGMIGNIFMLFLSVLFWDGLVKVVIKTKLRPDEVVRFPREALAIVIFLCLCAVFMFIHPVLFLVGWFKQRKANSGE